MVMQAGSRFERPELPLIGSYSFYIGLLRSAARAAR